MKYIISLSILFGIVFSNFSQAHIMLRKNPESYDAFFNSDQFDIRNDYEYGAEFKLEVLDKEMMEVPLDEWRSNLTDNTIRLNPGSIKTVKIEFRPSETQRKYYVCTKLSEARDREIDIYSRICLRLLIHPTLSR